MAYTLKFYCLLQKQVDEHNSLGFHIFPLNNVSHLGLETK